MSRYHEVYKAWQSDPERFWAGAAREIDWYGQWDKVFDPYAGQYGRWFPGAICNTCYNCVDRHLAERGDQAAIIYDSPVTGSKSQITYSELHDKVSRLAGALAARGVSKGDRIIIYMPAIPNAIVSMLACARLGAVHSVVFGGFAANELAVRIDDSKPKAILSASCGIEPGRVVKYKPLLDDAIALADHKPDFCVIDQRPQSEAELIDGRDIEWSGFVDEAEPVGCTPVAATDPLYVLYTSGTTGVPKGVVRDNGGHMVALKWSMSNIYDVAPGDVYWAASDVGWVVGHSYMAYAPLLHGCTTLLFEGKPVGTPDAGVFWRVIQEYSVVSLFTAPTAFRAIKKEDPNCDLLANYDISCLRSLFLAGERADSDTLRWAEDNLKIPVIDHWWQTETGWSIAANPLGLGLLETKHGSSCVAMPGYDVRILDEGLNELPPGKTGAISIKLPLPPGCFPTLWENDARFRESYLDEFPGYYKTADAGYMDEDGFIYIMARTDDIINVAGHRLSTGGMEEVVASHPDVAECAVVGIADSLKGQVPAGFIVLNSGIDRASGDIEAEVVQLVREKIGPVAAFKTVLVTKRLPKTRSGKILRGTMRSIADGESYKMPATIDDPDILEEISDLLKIRAVGRVGNP